MALNRAYPVTVDPSFYTTNTSNSSKSHYNIARSMATDTATFEATTQIACGYHPTYGKMQPYFKFINLPYIGSGSVVTKANLSTYVADYISSSTAYTTYYIHQVTSPLADSCWGSTFSFSSQPSYSSAFDFIEINSDLNEAGGKYRYLLLYERAASIYHP